MVAERQPLEPGSLRRRHTGFLRIVPTYQPAHIGRVYAAYGGWFIVLSLLWGWQVDGNAPNRFDVMGGMVCLMGVAVMMYWPR